MGVRENPVVFAVRDFVHALSELLSLTLNPKRRSRPAKAGGVARR